METTHQNNQTSQESAASSTTQSSGTASLTAPAYNNSSGDSRRKLLPKKVNFYRDIASKLVTGMMSSGVSQEKAYFVVAQVIQENGWSSEAPPGNNYFNVKGSNNGNSVTYSTHEEDTQGNSYQITDEFRAYESLEESMADYIAQLQRNWPKAYEALYSPEMGIAEFVDGLANGRLGRYASDMDYSARVTQLARQVGREFGLAMPDFKFEPVANISESDTGSMDVTQEPVTESKLTAMALKSVMGGDWDCTDEESVYRILVTLNHDEEKISAVKQAYQTLYGKTLEDKLRAEFSDTWIFGNQLSKALSYLNISTSSANDVQVSSSESTEPESTPVRDKLSRVDFTRSQRSPVQNRWQDDRNDSIYKDKFNADIENKIVEFFGEGYTRERVLNEIEEANKNGEHEKVAELKSKLYRANIYSVVDSLDVENNSLYQKGGGNTYCNIYAYDVVTAMGAYLPRVWWNANQEAKAIEAYKNGEEYNPDKKLHYLTSTAASENNLHEMNANLLNEWLPNIGEPYFGWEKASNMEAGQQAANAGNIVIICAANVNAGRSGHINVILPETEQYKAEGSGEGFRPLSSQAGSNNFKHKANRSQWWKNSSHKNGAAWIYRGELASPIMTPAQAGGQNQTTTTSNVTANNNNSPNTPTVETNAVNKQGIVTASVLNVRPVANTSQSPTGKLKKGTIVKVVAEQNGWYQLNSGGWVSGDYLTLSNIETTVEPESGGNAVTLYGTVTPSGLNVRSKPDISGKRISGLRRNDNVRLVAEQNGWYQIESGGWVSGTYLDVNSEKGVVNTSQQSNQTASSSDTSVTRNGYNIDAAVRSLNNRAKARSTGYCARYVRQAMEAGGLSTAGRPRSAKGYTSFLPSLGFREVSTTNYVKGDIVVFEAVPGHEYGHIAMWNGTQWVSDFRQRTIIVSSAYNSGVRHIYRWP